MTTTIRPSSLPSWNDCARRAAADLFAIELWDAGYELNELRGNIGALVGSGVHAGAAWTMDHKMQTGDLGDEKDAVECAVEHFRERSKTEGCEYDGVTRNQNAAEIATKRMTMSYRFRIAPTFNPTMVEQRLDAIVIENLFELSGQVDSYFVDEGGGLRDLKTGIRQRANMAQYGAYSLILRAHGLDTDRVIEDYIPRVAVDKPQPLPSTTVIPIDVAEQTAQETIDDMVRSYTTFKRRLKDGQAAPEAAFRANPQSVLCSKKYCRAYGTNFCRVALIKEES